MRLRWKHIDTALEDKLFLVTARERPAFQARVRHLRRLGIPDIAGQGSGTQLHYSREHAIELYLALLISQVIVKPTIVVEIVKNLKRHPYRQQVFGKHVGEPSLAIRPTNTGRPTTTFLPDAKALASYLEMPEKVLSVVKLSDAVRAMDAALEELE